MILEIFIILIQPCLLKLFPFVILKDVYGSLENEIHLKGILHDFPPNVETSIEIPIDDRNWTLFFIQLSKFLYNRFLHRDGHISSASNWSAV